MSLYCSGQLQNSIPLPIAMTSYQLPSHMQWLHGSDGPDFMLSADASLLPQRNLEPSSGTVLYGYPGYFSAEKPECSKQGPEEAFNELNQNSCSQLQLGAHDPYQCCDFLGENNFNPDDLINIQESHVDYQLNSYQPPTYGYDAGIQTWPSSSGSPGIVIVDEHPYAQQPNKTER